MVFATMENAHVHLVMLVMIVQTVHVLTNATDMELVSQVFVCVSAVVRDMIVPFQNA